MAITLFLFYLIIGLLVYDFVRKNKIGKKDPRQPWALPILGHLHLFGTQPHRSFTELAKKYGGIFTIWMGDERSVVITDPNILRELYVKNHSNFYNRAHTNSIKIYSGKYVDLSFSNDEIWKNNRRLVSAALTKTKILNVINLVEQQAAFLINSMNYYSKSGEAFYPHKYFNKYTMNIVTSIGFSKTISENESVDEGPISQLLVPFNNILEDLGSGNLGDFVWYTRPFFYSRNKNLGKDVKKVYTFLEVLYNQHIETLDESNPRDLMDQLIISTGGKQKDMVIHVSMDFILAGSDTNGSTLEWFCIFLANNPDFQKKAYEELISVVGKDCKAVTTKVRDNCPYIVGAIKETLRVRTPAPLSLIRVANEDFTTSEGVFIPKGTQIVPNIYGIAQNFVDDPSTFKPERWVEYYKNKSPTRETEANSNDLKPTNTNEKILPNDLDKVVLPFSIGARNCPGNIISEINLFLACSNILLNFEITTTNGKKIDETEVFGLTIHPKDFSIKLTKRN
ncbi:hypothetical protein RB653_000291 [Dictyostelium firmibasis]|uniref:Cytochrome P450 n=1 Tax=Dictyostelium firmibasis TaxID=79012 RepID=A0AAN7YU85_9MYCE